MITRGIRELVDRDWEAVRDNTDTYWSERIARLGPIEACRMAEELRRFALMQHPEWPDPAMRADDLDAHIHLSALFRRAGTTRRR